jgi:hypothetical protein
LKNYLRCPCGVKKGSKCSFITHKLRFFAFFRLALAASKTFFNNLLGQGLRPSAASPLLPGSLLFNANGKR